MNADEPSESAESSDESSQCLERTEVTAFYDAVYADNRDDSQRVTDHVLRVAGLGATVGGIVLGTQVGDLPGVVAVFLVLAVAFCLIAGGCSGVSYFLAQRRGERQLVRLDEALASHHQTRDISHLRTGVDSARELARTWDGYLTRVNTGAAISAGIGLICFAVAAVLVVAVAPAKKPEASVVNVHGNVDTIHVNK